MTEQPKFWKPQPRPPFQDWRTYSLLVPMAFSVIGAAVFSVFTFAFDSIDILSPVVQDAMIVFAAVCVAFGAEVGTPGAVIEVFRKIRRHEHNSWDFVALAVSLLATLVAIAIAFARRIGGDASWTEFVIEWGPAVVVGFVALDTYGGYIELGALFGSYEQRMEQWLAERDAYEHRTVATAEPSVAIGTPQIAKVTDWRAIVAGLNGQRSTLTEQRAVELIRAAGLVEPSGTTLRRWLSESSNGGH
jgi:hypothetical protein